MPACYGRRFYCLLSRGPLSILPLNLLTNVVMGLSVDIAEAEFYYKKAPFIIAMPSGVVAEYMLTPPILILVYTYA